MAVHMIVNTSGREGRCVKGWDLPLFAAPVRVTDRARDWIGKDQNPGSKATLEIIVAHRHAAWKIFLFRFPEA